MNDRLTFVIRYLMHIPYSLVKFVKNSRGKSIRTASTVEVQPYFPNIRLSKCGNNVYFFSFRYFDCM